MSGAAKSRADQTNPRRPDQHLNPVEKIHLLY